MKAIAKMDAGLPNSQWHGKIKALIEKDDPRWNKVFRRSEGGKLCIVKGVEYEIECDDLPEWFEADGKQVRGSEKVQRPKREDMGSSNL